MDTNTDIQDTDTPCNSNALSEDNLDRIRNIRMKDIPTLAPKLRHFLLSYMVVNSSGGFYTLEDYLPIYLSYLPIVMEDTSHG